jgi:hypothetical protein
MVSIDTLRANRITTLAAALPGVFRQRQHRGVALRADGDGLSPRKDCPLELLLKLLRIAWRSTR